MAEGLEQCSSRLDVCSVGRQIGAKGFSFSTLEVTKLPRQRFRDEAIEIPTVREQIAQEERTAGFNREFGGLRRGRCL